MIGIGAANVAAGFFQGFAVSTSGSRTAVAEQSGAKSQLTGVVGAGLVAVLLLFFNSLLADLPQSALAGVVIAAALSLMNFTALRKYWRVRKSSFLLSIVATLGVVALGVLEGIVVAIFLAVLHVLQAQLVAARRGARPHRRQRGLARHRRASRARGGTRRRRVPVGGTALLRQRGHVPPGDPAAW